MTILLALDPGQSTGFSKWEYSDIEPLSLIEYGTIPVGLQGFLRWVWSKAAWDDIDIVVAEDFILDGRTPKPDTTPLEILGAIEALCFEPVAKPLIRQRNTLKATVPDATLKRLGLWWKGKGHDRDSARHAIAYMRRLQHKPTIRAFYPEKDEEE